MIPLALDEVRELATGELTVAPGALEATGVRVDSRKVEPGDLFVAVGSGAEFADRTIPFDDREVARDALRRLGAAA